MKYGVHVTVLRRLHRMTKRDLSRIYEEMMRVIGRIYELNERLQNFVSEESQRSTKSATLVVAVKIIRHMRSSKSLLRGWVVVLRQGRKTRDLQIQGNSRFQKKTQKSRG